MDSHDYERFLLLRDALHKEVRACIELDGHCKSYEGMFEIGLPSIFEGDPWRIQLHCYVVGPSRHYSWEGETFAEALDKCEKDVRLWIKESSEGRAWGVDD